MLRLLTHHLAQSPTIGLVHWLIHVCSTRPYYADCTTTAGWRKSDRASFLIPAQHAMLGRMNKECCVSAPGRVCFAGEKLDWTGGSAIVCAVEDLRVYVHVREGVEPDVSTITSSAPFDASDRFDAHDLNSPGDG